MFDLDLPFWAMVGNPNPTNLSDLAIGYAAFYHLLFKGQSLLSCIEGMKVASGNGGFELIIGKHANEAWLTEVRKNLAPPPPSGPPSPPSNRLKDQLRGLRPRSRRTQDAAADAYKQSFLAWRASSGERR